IPRHLAGKPDSATTLPPAREPGPLLRNPTAEFSPCGPLRNSRATTSRSAQSSSAQARLAREPRHPLPAGRSSTEMRAESGARRGDSHRSAVQSGACEWEGNPLPPLPADRCKPRQSWWSLSRCRLSCGMPLPDVELKLPAAAVIGHAPQFKHAGFRNVAFEGHRNNLFASLVFLLRRKKNLDGRKFFEIVAYLINHGSGDIGFAG